MSNDKLKKIYGSRKRRRDVRDWTRFDGGDVYKMKGILEVATLDTIQKIALGTKMLLAHLNG